MCYDIKTSLETQLKRAIRLGDQKAVEAIKAKLGPLTDLPLFHASGFSHPKLLIYTDRSPALPELAFWGLVPHWIKDREQMKKFWNNTLNARGETIFEKPSFRDSAKNHHCLIYVDGFYEHHHIKSKSYPYYIHNSSGAPMILAGLYSEWLDRETGELINTFTIVTTDGNKMLSKIHNNPKLDGPRMPVILDESWADQWLNPSEDKLGEDALKKLIRPFPDENLEAYTVGKLRGKDAVGNIPEATKKVLYEEVEHASFS